MGGSNLGEGNWLQLQTNLAYGDNWSGYIRGRRFAKSDSKKGLYDKTSMRFQVGVNRANVVKTEDYSIGLGGTLRSQGSYDFYIAEINFKAFGFLSGYLDYGYYSRSAENASDSNYIEFQPKVSYMGWAVSYYLEGEKAIENDSMKIFHQIRLFTPKWKIGEKFTFSFENRWTFKQDADDNYGNKKYGIGQTLDSGELNRLYIHTNYNVNENVDLFLTYGYQIGKWEMSKNGEKKKNYLGLLETGVKYTF